MLKEQIKAFAELVADYRTTGDWALEWDKHRVWTRVRGEARRTLEVLDQLGYTITPKQ
jgi:hypothetical protein